MCIHINDIHEIKMFVVSKQRTHMWRYQWVVWLSINCTYLCVGRWQRRNVRRIVGGVCDVIKYQPRIVVDYWSLEQKQRILSLCQVRFVKNKRLERETSGTRVSLRNYSTFYQHHTYKTYWKLLKLELFSPRCIENCVGKIEKDMKIIIFWMSFFGHSEIEYFWYSNDEVGPLSS